MSETSTKFAGTVLADLVRRVTELVREQKEMNRLLAEIVRLSHGRDP